MNVREVVGVCNHVFVETADGQRGLGDPGECMCAEGEIHRSGEGGL